MRDRIPTKPNRYAVYDDAHNFIRYEYHERADEPTQVGDPLNKANLLPDTVATALGLTGNPQVKDALSKLKTLADIGISRAQIATGSYTGTGTFGASNPNSLTFSDVPLFVAVVDKTATTVSWFLIAIDTLTVDYRAGGATFFGSGDAGNPASVYAKLAGSTISYYSNSTEFGQFNVSGRTYKTVAIFK